MTDKNSEVSEMDGFLTRLFLGLFLIFLVAFGYVWMQKETSNFGRVLAVVLATGGLMWTLRYIYDWSRLKEMYYVARWLVPKYELEHYGKKPNVNDVRVQKYKGVFLINYPSNNLTVAWRVGVGAEARESMTLEQLKLRFDPNEAVIKDDPLPAPTVVSGVEKVEE